MLRLSNPPYCRPIATVVRLLSPSHYIVRWAVASSRIDACSPLKAPMSNVLIFLDPVDPCCVLKADESPRAGGKGLMIQWILLRTKLMTGLLMYV